MTTEIKTGTSRVTLVNVFTTKPDTQQRLLDILTKFSREEVVKQPGFISANLHASKDGLRVVNYAQWESLAALGAMVSVPANRVHMDEAENLCEGKPDVHYYEVIATFGAATAAKGS